MHPLTVSFLFLFLFKNLPDLIDSPEKYLDFENENQNIEFLLEQHKEAENYIKGNNNFFESVLRIAKQYRRVYDYKLWFKKLVRKHGDYYFTYANTSSIIIRDSISSTDEWEVFNATEIKGSESISRDGKMATYCNFNEKNQKWILKIRNLISLREYEDEAISGACRTTWFENSQGFIYLDEPSFPAVYLPNQEINRVLKYHKYGSDVETDFVLFSKLPRVNHQVFEIKFFSTPEDGYLLLSLHSVGSKRISNFFVDLKSTDSNLSFTPFPTNDETNGDFFFEFLESENESSHYMLTNYPNSGHENGKKIVLLNLNNCKNNYSNCINPIVSRQRGDLDSDEDLLMNSGCVLLERYRDILVFYSNHGPNKFDITSSGYKSYPARYHLGSGAFLQILAQPIIGEIHDLNCNGNEIIFQNQILGLPPKYFRIDVTKPNEIQEFYRSSTISKESDVFNNYMTIEEIYKSKDGTIVPIYITHRKDFKKDGNSTTLILLTSPYKGIRRTGKYASLNAFMPLFDGIQVFPVLRPIARHNGNETWFLEQGKIQMALDLISATEFLIQQNYTNSGKIVLFNDVFSSPLLSVAITQKKELFAAAVDFNPVYDLLNVGRTSLMKCKSNETDIKGCPSPTEISELERLSPKKSLELDSDPEVSYSALLIYPINLHNRWVVNPRGPQLVAAMKSKTKKNPVLLLNYTLNTIRQKRDFEIDAECLTFISKSLGLNTNFEIPNMNAI